MGSQTRSTGEAQSIHLGDNRRSTVKYQDRQHNQAPETNVEDEYAEYKQNTTSKEIYLCWIVKKRGGTFSKSFKK